eukprot:CAMPEP_0197938770 /NCGR_PEP_ID=MMETSP1439-20131203/118671_1 /TAXON_ID=66791 /ORGANISM="Gonyaulax spinifera, Strain CCMP409" /LENGTH=242 /DNA_ID=CAMNT_0043561853 /DNA_START=18 /DNA_END=747 /DNA_ORIENTATION=-
MADGPSGQQRMTLAFLPVLPTGNNQRRKRDVVDEDPEDEKAMIKSLQIKTDERYAAIRYYRDHGGTASKDGHFARMVRTNRQLIGLPQDKTVLNENSDLADVSNWTLEAERFGGRQQRQAVANVGDRIEWQESFDQKVRRLLVDFQLSDAPSCRLNHLDRVHGWFEEHGAKQARKVREGPNYLTADRSGRMPAGSTKNLPGSLSTTSQILSNAFKGGEPVAARGASGASAPPKWRPEGAPPG